MSRLRYIVLLFLFSQGVFGQSKTVVLKKNVYIRGDHVCLFDLVSVDEKVENTCYIDTPSSPVYMSLEEVKSFYEYDIPGYKWIGKGVRIIPVLQVVNDAQVQEKLFAKFSQNPRFHASEYSLVLEEEVRLPVNTGAEFSMTGNYLQAGGKFVLIKIPSVSSKHGRIIRVSATLRKRISVYIIKSQELSAGDRIKSEDVAILQTFIDDENKIPCEKNPVGAKLLRALRQGDMVRTKDIRFEPDVKKGDLVIVEITFKNIQIHLETVAKEEGYIGRTLELSAGRGKTIKAKLISKDRAVVTKDE